MDHDPTTIQEYQKVPDATWGATKSTSVGKTVRFSKAYVFFGTDNSYQQGFVGANPTFTSLTPEEDT